MSQIENAILYHLLYNVQFATLSFETLSDTLLLYSLFNDDALRHSETSFVMLAKVERAMPLGQFCLKSYLSHQYQSMIECAAIVICLIQKKLKSQTKNQFGK